MDYVYNYLMTYSIFCFNLRSKSSRYCRQPLLNNLSAFMALSIIASGRVHLKSSLPFYTSDLYTATMSIEGQTLGLLMGLSE